MVLKTNEDRKIGLKLNDEVEYTEEEYNEIY